MPRRRSFLQSSIAAFMAACGSASATQDKIRNPLCVFTKPFNSLSNEELAAKIEQLGFDGIEAPIRPGGHIEPEAVPDELPKLVDALKRRGRTITVLTSDINNPDSAVNEKVLRTAAELGIRYYRMKYFKYDESKPIIRQVDEWTRQISDLAALNKELGITGVYQNHAGRNYFGAAIWDVHRALRNIEPESIGMAYDIRHATAEAGSSWPVGFQLIRPHVKVVYVKDFVWGEHKPVNVPLGKGRVSKEFFRLLEKSDFDGPISLHEEYLDHRKPELVPDHWQAIETDLKMLKSWL